MSITGHTLIEWGFKPGPIFGQMLDTSNKMRANGVPDGDIIAFLRNMKPVAVPTTPLRDAPLPFASFIEPETADEIENTEAVIQHMSELMRVPTIKAGAIMPDACPSGSAIGTIPVGGVVACENAIHPGFHSADICCSLAISVFKDRMYASEVLTTALNTTHFGPGRRTASEARQNKEFGAAAQAVRTEPVFERFRGLRHAALYDARRR